MKKNGILYLLTAGLLVFTFSCASGSKTEKRSGEEQFGSNFITVINPSESAGALDLAIESSGNLQYTVFKLDNPRRLVIDMPGADSSAFSAPIELSKGVAWKISARYFPKSNNSRVEVFLNEAASYKVTREKDNRIKVSMKPLEMSRSLGPERIIGEDEIEVLSVDLRESAGLARIVVTYKGKVPMKYSMHRKRQLNRISLDIHNAKIKRANEKLMTVEAKKSILSNIAVFQFTTKPKGVVKVLANLSEFTSSNVYEKDGKLILDIGSDAILAEASQIKEEQEAKKVVAAPKGTDATEGEPGEPGEPGEEFTGKKISFDFQSAEIHNILRIIADVSGMNIITSDNVSGKVTMKLKDVPWDLALDVILKNNQLAMVKKGNIIRVATVEDISKEKSNMASDIKVEEEVQPLFLKVFQINYESSEKLKANLEAIKSERGSIDVNIRSNTLIIRDTKQRLAEMERLVEILDKRAIQVLIEARIVEVSHTHARQLGIKWGGRLLSRVNSTFPSSISLSGVDTTGSPSSTAGGLVDLGIAAPKGQLGIRLGSLTNTAYLDMQLQAMENDGKGKIISMPKIATMNNVEAIIESGRDIPYSTTSSEGTKTEFKSASLILKVTPHVSPDNYIRLEIEANKDEPDWANALPNSPPPILRKRAKTEILIPDGTTTVIGGLFKENTSNTQSGVPFFSKIPILGWLFKSKLDATEGEELLIFITPKIL